MSGIKLSDKGAKYILSKSDWLMKSGIEFEISIPQTQKNPKYAVKKSKEVNNKSKCGLK